MTQPESPLEPVDTVHLGVCCGRYDGNNCGRQPETANDTDSDNFGPQTTASDERQSIEENPKPQVAGSIPVPPANPGFMRGEALFRTHNVSPTWLCLIELPQVSSLTH